MTHAISYAFQAPLSVCFKMIPRSRSNHRSKSDHEGSRMHSPLASNRTTLAMLADPVKRYGPEPALLLTNDDGIHPEDALILPLAQNLVAKGHNVVVVAPGQNNSACSQRVTLGSPLTLRRHLEYENRFASAESNGTRSGILKVFSVDKGTPADCVITAIEPRTGLLAMLGVYPLLTLSGVNYGQNMGSDVLYSGTFAGARQAAMYGIPAIASSVDMHRRDVSTASQKESCARAIAATVEMTEASIKKLPSIPPDMGRLNPELGLSPCAIARDKTKDIDERVRDAFARGDIVFNINIPKAWNEEYKITRLDSLLYRNLVHLDYVPSGKNNHAEETIGINMWSARPDGLLSEGSDLDALRRGYASITAVGTWPTPHPLAASEQLLNDVAQNGADWIPKVSALHQEDKLKN